MATVTGLTAARMLDIEAASIVNGSVDTEGNLTLVTHSGVEISAGNVKGPQGLPGDDGDDGLPGEDGDPGADASSVIPPQTVSALPSTYPLGISQFTYTDTTGWPTPLGTVFTFLESIARGFQIVSEKSTDRIWFRNVGQDSWSSFHQIATVAYVNSLVVDSGWIPLTVHNPTYYALWNVAEPIQIRRWGKMVQLKGAAKNLVAGVSDSPSEPVGGNNQMFVIPEQFLPDIHTFNSVWVCQGSSVNRWQLRISNGAAFAGRYGPSTAAAGAWLPFNVTWLLD